MKLSNPLYCAPECKLYNLKLNRVILVLSNENRDMNTFVGDADSAGDCEGGIGGNNYDL